MGADIAVINRMVIGGFIEKVTFQQSSRRYGNEPCGYLGVEKEKMSFYPLRFGG